MARSVARLPSCRESRTAELFPRLRSPNIAVISVAPRGRLAARKITRFWVEQYAYLVKKLESIPEGNGTVLDNSCILLANEQWTAHNAPKVPLLVAGGLSGTLETGRTLDYEMSKERKLSAMYLSLLDRLGAPLPRFGDAKDLLVGL